MKESDKRILKTAEMKFMRHTGGYSSLLEHRTNKDILEEFKLYPDEKKLVQYKQKSLNHVSRWKTLDKQNNSLIIELSKNTTWTTIKETTGRIQS
jgi:hypothetical protein